MSKLSAKGTIAYDRTFPGRSVLIAGTDDGNVIILTTESNGTCIAISISGDAFAEAVAAVRGDTFTASERVDKIQARLEEMWPLDVTGFPVKAAAHNLARSLVFWQTPKVSPEVDRFTRSFPGTITPFTQAFVKEAGPLLP